MAEPRMRDRRRFLLGPLALLVVLAATPTLVLGGGSDSAADRLVVGVEAPGASCPDTTEGPAATGELCEDAGAAPNGGAAGIDLGGLLPFLAAAFAGVVIALAVAFLVLRRRLPAPMAPAGPGEWWTCARCGATNISGSPRCYSCGAWPG